MKREIRQAPIAHMVVSREQWRVERMQLLREEKELTQRSDELARRRQALPWVRLDKDYRFDSEQGNASLAELFNGRSQLLVYHFMFGPDYTAGCPSCSSIADGFNGFAVHLASHDVTLAAVSRAPLVKLQAYKRRMGWTFPWASSFSSDFNFDFAVGITEAQQHAGGAEYNYRREPATPAGRELEDMQSVKSDSGNGCETPVAQFARMCGTDPSTYIRERPGLSAFVLDDGVVHHTYSTYARGLDGLWGMYQWLDHAPKGRNETGVWWRRHDEYANSAADCCHA
ncbi:MAG: thioredoxin family protein [Dokdonella sp.]